MRNSLGIEKNPADTRVVVAMSGGVDSSVVAAMLRDEGYDVVGITLQLYDHGQMAGKKGACCAGQDIHDARRVAETMNIPHYVLNYENRFKESVMEDFADTYLAGQTPIPCIKCNQSVKFRDLLQVARELGAEVMATGHYVQRRQENGAAYMYRAADSTRDQSYFLFTTTQPQLDFLRFPLGHLKSKDETRALAGRYGLQVADKPDSQDICFVPSGGYAKVIEKLRPGTLDPGNIVLENGEVVGQHDGIINFTVGQRRGIGVGGTEEPLYVIRLNAAKKQVVVGPKESLLTGSFMIRDCNWLFPALVAGSGFPVHQTPPFGGVVKLRSMHPGAEASIELLQDNMARVTLKEPQAAVSPGQACVAYAGERMLGGGWIAAS